MIQRTQLPGLFCQNPLTNKKLHGIVKTAGNEGDIFQNIIGKTGHENKEEKSMKMKKLIAAAAAMVMSVSALSVTASAEWYKSGDKRLYKDDSGKYVTGFENIDGNTYYFDKNGYLKTGWVTFSNGKKYYFSEKNGMRTGWLKMTDGTAYYMGDDGVMTTGWQNIDGETYYFKTDGTMKTGWLDGKGGERYFLNSDGTLARNVSLKISGVTYDFDGSGKATKRKTSSSTGTSSSTSKSSKSEFETPKAGASKSSVLKSCGIYNYEKTSDGRNTYVGRVMFGGIESILILNFNSDDKLFGYSLSIPMSYSTYLDMLLIDLEYYGYDYDYDDGEYNWVIGNTSVYVSYDFEYDYYDYTTFFHQYFD